MGFVRLRWSPDHGANARRAALRRLLCGLWQRRRGRDLDGGRTDRIAAPGHMRRVDVAEEPLVWGTHAILVLVFSESAQKQEVNVVVLQAVAPHGALSAREGVFAAAK